MPWYHFIWTEDIEAHIAEHDISVEDYQEIVQHPYYRDASRGSGNPMAFGYTRDGRHVVAIYRHIDEVTIEPITAYEAPEPRDRRYGKND